jgi:pimeloyl-ACP methyl ester carboxylesterase
VDTVTSADGTVIAYDHVGDGPPLVVCVGAFGTRKTFVPPAGLTARFTVYTYDRRGRGDSGDTRPYAPEREYEDLAAVVSAGPGTPFVYGHSSGAAIALLAAAGGVPLGPIVAYEAPFKNEDTPPPSADPAPHIRSLVAAGRRGDAVEFWMSEIARVPPEVISGMKSTPWFAAMEPLTPTLPYDIEMTAGGVPVAELTRITVPVLVLGGARSPAWFQRSVADQAAAIPGGRLQMIDGCDHNAPPTVIAPILFGFFR